MENQSAIVKIVNAKVSRHVGSQGGFAITENVTLPNGTSYDRSWTVWSKDPAPYIGATVTVTGLFSAKKREYETQGETRVAIDLNVNEPAVVIHEEDHNAPF